MDDQEFFDALYQVWAKTTHANDAAWVVQENESFPGTFMVWADNDEVHSPVSDFMSEPDANFLAMVHGLIPELIRRCVAALDESDRLDIEKDELHSRIAELEQEIAEMERNEV